MAHHKCEIHLNSLRGSLHFYPPKHPKKRSSLFRTSMADYAAPSFSLGLDLGFDSEPQIAVEEESSSPNSVPTSAPANAHALRQDGEEFGTEIAEDSDLETGPEEEPPRMLKRLRRGSTLLRATPPSSFNPDDDIEEFSSQEDGLKGIQTYCIYNRRQINCLKML